MEEMAYLWSHQESNDELKLKIHYTSLELEAVKAKANEEISKNTESLKQLLHLLKLVCQERDEARDQIHKLLNKIMPISINNSMIPHPLIKPAKANSSFAESNSLSDAYYHSSSSPVNSLDFSNINTNTNSFVQDYRMLHGGFDAMNSPLEANHVALMMESMIKGKALPQRGSLLKAVIEAGSVLQTLYATNPPYGLGKLSSPRWFGNGNQNDQMIGGENMLSFNDVNSSNCQERMIASCYFGPVEKKQRLQ
ncbi:hypothetical protein QVD17_34315 [Tagetes erecta]|uniref:Uncharacterized protein n=1 Tax=Tagetes erecta TaxID=13708 RepID=A0AAD8NLL3_TARER|nr:hypothetical protein QVD17_34315 [Tagetes erecta]